MNYNAEDLHALHARVMHVAGVLGIRITYYTFEEGLVEILREREGYHPILDAFLIEYLNLSDEALRDTDRGRRKAAREHEAELTAAMLRKKAIAAARQVVERAIASEATAAERAQHNRKAAELALAALLETP